MKTYPKCAETPGAQREVPGAGGFPGDVHFGRAADLHDHEVHHQPNGAVLPRLHWPRGGPPTISERLASCIWDITLLRVFTAFYKCPGRFRAFEERDYGVPGRLFSVGVPEASGKAVVDLPVKQGAHHERLERAGEREEAVRLCAVRDARGLAHGAWPSAHSRDVQDFHARLPNRTSPTLPVPDFAKHLQDSHTKM